MVSKLNSHRLYCTPSKTQQVYLIDENEINNKKSIPSANKFTNRTYTCGELRINNVGESVVLCGWLQYKRMNKFIVLRDSYGETQILVSDQVRNKY